MFGAAYCRSLSTFGAASGGFPAGHVLVGLCYLYLGCFALYLYTNPYSLQPNSSSSLSYLFIATNDTMPFVSIPWPILMRLFPKLIAKDGR